MIYNSQDFIAKYKRKPHERDDVYEHLLYSFDIETTRTEARCSYMYIWQIGLDNDVILGRTWEEYIEVMQHIEKLYVSDRKIICWVHNLSHEFQFFKKRIKWAIRKDGSYDIFATDDRKIIKAITAGGTVFLDSAILSGRSLASLAKTYTQTQKLVGDLDYDILRNNKTELTEQELAYCVNDVVILTEWADYCFKRWSNKIPLTKTGIVRDDLKRNFRTLTKDEQSDYRKMIHRCYPTEKQYATWFRWLYCGGMVHADWMHVNQIIESDDAAAVDFKSSYPSTMFDKMPYSLKLTKPSMESIRWVMKDIESRCMILKAHFVGLRRTTSHATISKHKALVGEGSCYCDNGRIIYADNVTLIMTEYDYAIVRKYYTWEKIELQSLRTGVKDYLPTFVLDTLYQYYVKKETQPKNSLEYTLAKQNLNSMYGCCCTKVVEQDLVFNGHKMVPASYQKSFIKSVNSAILLPQWGIWISSKARNNLLTIVYEITKNSEFGSDAIYMDTDSIKLLNYSKHKHLIDDYNRKILERNERIKAERGYDIGKLGIFAFEGYLKKLKTLGCKRYICDVSEDGIEPAHTEVTIAGLPKQALLDYCKRRDLDVYDAFSNRLRIPESESMKKTVVYKDDMVAEEVDGVEMSEESCACIVPVPFRMTMASDFIELLSSLRNKQFMGGRL